MAVIIPEIKGDAFSFSTDKAFRESKAKARRRTGSPSFLSVAINGYSQILGNQILTETGLLSQGNVLWPRFPGLSKTRVYLHSDIFPAVNFLGHGSAQWSAGAAIVADYVQKGGGMIIFLPCGLYENQLPQAIEGYWREVFGATFPALVPAQANQDSFFYPQLNQIDAGAGVGPIANGKYGPVNIANAFQFADASLPILGVNALLAAAEGGLTMRASQPPAGFGDASSALFNSFTFGGGRVVVFTSRILGLDNASNWQPGAPIFTLARNAAAWVNKQFP